jgi:hypothetical protein
MVSSAFPGYFGRSPPIWQGQVACRASLRMARAAVANNRVASVVVDGSSRLTDTAAETLEAEKDLG